MATPNLRVSKNCGNNLGTLATCSHRRGHADATAMIDSPIKKQLTVLIAALFVTVILNGCAFTGSHEKSAAANGGKEKLNRFHSLTIQNTKPRRDVTGAIIDAHDGCLQFFEGRYYLYGTAYGRSAGFGINNRFRVYSSADLERWQFDGELLVEPPKGVFYRPYVVFNPTTRKYVLWFNWYPKLWDGKLGVAVSDTPVGPFKMVNLALNLSQAADRPGDGSLFVDDDGTGYFIYTVIGQGHAIRIERLTPDYLGTSGAASAVLGTGCEAPVLFRRGDLYYALFDRNCCFCPAGSGARVLVARSPLGPYRPAGNINRDALDKPIIAAQQTFVARIPTRDGIAYLWLGDRWGSRPDGIKGHDLQYWSAPLKFAPDGNILPLENLQSWQAQIRIGAERKAPSPPYSWPKQKDSNPLKIHPCSNEPIPPEEWDTGEQP
jgi:Glycosyl hydrolases family 43